MKERRKHKRYSIAYPLEWGKKLLESVLDLKDVSKSGVAFTVEDKVNEQENINLRIFLKNRMFIVEAIVVHVKRLKDNLYKIGVEFVDAPGDFHAMLEKEIEEITQVHRECNLYNRKNLSFKTASVEYLKEVSFPDEISSE